MYVLANSDILTVEMSNLKFIVRILKIADFIYIRCEAIKYLLHK